MLADIAILKLCLLGKSFANMSKICLYNLWPLTDAHTKFPLLNNMSCKFLSVLAQCDITSILQEVFAFSKICCVNK